MRDPEIEEWRWGTLSLWPGCERTVRPLIVFTNFLGSNGLSVLCCVSRLSCVSLLVTCQSLLSMGILQARILDWVAMPSSRGSSQPRDWTQVSYVSCTGRGVLYHWCHLGSLYTPIKNIKKKKNTYPHKATF